MPTTKHQPLISDNMSATFKVGSLVSLLIGVSGSVWWIATEYSNLQNRLTNIETTLAWHTAAIRGDKVDGPRK